MADSSLAAIYVSFNTRDLLRTSLRSLFHSLSRYGPDQAEVWVVDNASADGSAAMVAKEFTGARLIANADNRGFGAANNQAIRASRGDHLLLINPDTIVEGDAPARLSRFLAEHAEAAVVGPGLLSPDGSFQHSAFRFPSLAMGLIEFFPLNHRLLDSRLNGRYPRSCYRQPFRVDHPLGACLLLRRAAVEKAGLFDESFFMYYEEVELCLRLRRAGWQAWCLPQARVVHYGGQSTGQVAPEMFRQLHSNKLRLFRKHYSPATCLAARWILHLGAWRRRVALRRQARNGARPADASQWDETYSALLRL